jgi:hypothetical protein
MVVYNLECQNVKNNFLAPYFKRAAQATFRPERPVI